MSHGFLIALAVVHASFSTAGCAVFVLAAALSQQERDAVDAVFNTNFEYEDDAGPARQGVQDAVIALSDALSGRAPDARTASSFALLVETAVALAAEEAQGTPGLATSPVSAEQGPVGERVLADSQLEHAVGVLSNQPTASTTTVQQTHMQLGDPAAESEDFTGGALFPQQGAAANREEFARLLEETMAASAGYLD